MFINIHKNPQIIFTFCLVLLGIIVQCFAMDNSTNLDLYSKSTDFYFFNKDHKLCEPVSFNKIIDAINNRPTYNPKLFLVTEKGKISFGHSEESREALRPIPDIREYLERIDKTVTINQFINRDRSQRITNLNQLNNKTLFSLATDKSGHKLIPLHVDTKPTLLQKIMGWSLCGGAVLGGYFAYTKPELAQDMIKNSAKHILTHEKLQKTLIVGGIATVGIAGAKIAQFDHVIYNKLKRILQNLGTFKKTKFYDKSHNDILHR